MKETISTPRAPAAIGPYSQATKYNGLIFVSGQLPLEPTTGQLHTGSISEQTVLAMNNVKRIVEAAGSSLDNILKTTILLADMKDFAAVNEAYGQFFPSDPPARVAYQVAALPKGAQIEIEVICAQ